MIYVEYFYKFLKLFSFQYKRKLLCLMIMSVIAGFLEFFGIALIVPLIVLILDPSQVSSLPVLSGIVDVVRSQSILFLIVFGIVFAFVVKNLFMILYSYCQLSVLKSWQGEVLLLMFKKYLFSTYESKMKINEKFTILRALQLVMFVFANFISKCFTLLSNAIILCIIIVLLLIKFKYWTVITGIFFIVSGILQNKFFKTQGQKVVRRQILLNDYINTSILSAIINIKDIKIFAREQYFYDEYKKTIKENVKTETLIDFYGLIPQNIVELLIIVSILIMSVGVFYTAQGDSKNVVASFGLLAAALFRIAPLANKIQMNLNFIISNKPYLDEFFSVYDLYSKMDEMQEPTEEKISLDRTLKIKNLSFSYGGNNVIKDLSLEVKKGEFVGIIGESGVGKTTFMDLLMGLLTSYNGEILADEIALKGENLVRWINSIGYVPQTVTTLPQTIAQNIAFGVNKDEIDYERVSSVVEQAQLSQYISNLPDGINTVLGEVQTLSQGQKQRIGIARALYKSPDILFLDEVTSALDVETENKITDTLNALKGEKTIIAIAHRLSTLKKCDKIFFFKSNNEVLCGTFEELAQMDEDFKRILKLASIEKEQP